MTGDLNNRLEYLCLLDKGSELGSVSSGM